MEWQPIAKARDAFPRAPNLADYDARRDFNWDRARTLLAGLPGGALNIAHEAVFRHADGAAAERVAIRFLAQDAAPRPCTYRELAADARRVANVLAGLGVQRGERVATLLGRIPPLYATVLGTLAAGAVFCPMFSAFGPEPVKARLSLGSVRVLVTTDLLYRRKVAPIRAELPELRHVLVVRTPGAGELPEGTLDFAALLAKRPRRISRPCGPTPRTTRCCISPAAPPASPRACCTRTPPSPRISPRRAGCSTCRTATSTGARRIRAG